MLMKNSLENRIRFLVYIYLIFVFGYVMGVLITNFHYYFVFLKHVFFNSNLHTEEAKQLFSAFMFSGTNSTFIITFFIYFYVLVLYLYFRASKNNVCHNEIEIFIYSENTAPCKFLVYKYISMFFGYMGILSGQMFIYIKYLLPLLIKQIIRAVAIWSIVLNLGKFATDYVTYKITRPYTQYSFFSALLIPIIMSVAFIIEDGYQLTKMLSKKDDGDVIKNLKNKIIGLYYQNIKLEKLLGFYHVHINQKFLTYHRK